MLTEALKVRFPLNSGVENVTVWPCSTFLHGEFSFHRLMNDRKLVFLRPAMHLSANRVRFPKSSHPPAEDDVIISHLILQIIPLSQPL